MLIQSFLVFDEVAEVDPETGVLERRRRSSSDVPPLHETRGVFLDDGDASTAFFRWRGSLWLSIGEVLVDLDASRCDVRWLREGDGALLDVMNGEDIVARLRYHPEREISDDPTSFRDAEQGDFGLFVSNVLADPERRARIYTAG